MAVTVSSVESYSTYGRCLRIANDAMEVLVTTDVGPRIIWISKPGEDNILFNDTDDKIVQKGPGMEKYFGEGAEYHYYGGHRMWMAPQHDIKTNIPDHFPVEVSYIENGAIFSPPENEAIGEKSWMKVVMDPEKPEINVECSFKNISDKPYSMAVWQVTEVVPGGLTIVPMRKKPPVFRRPAPGEPRPVRPIPGPNDYIGPDRGIALFGFTNLNDPRLFIDNNFLTLKYDASQPFPFKIGTANHEGWVLHVNDKGKVIKFLHPHDASLTYTDGGSSFEAYTAAAFTEVEMLGAYKELQPGDVISDYEIISLGDAQLPTPDARDIEAIEAFAAKHL